LGGAQSRRTALGTPGRLKRDRTQREDAKGFDMLLIRALIRGGFAAPACEVEMKKARRAACRMIVLHPFFLRRLDAGLTPEVARG